jgi:prepilin-type N-terminal cleavage/methylation domain-containing protein
MSFSPAFHGWSLSLHAPRRRRRGRGGPRRAFTLVEVLVALLLFAIVVPVAMNGIDLSNRGATMAKRQAEAATLAEAKLAELVAQQQSSAASTPNQGDFGPDFPGYRWTLQSTQGEYQVTELNLWVYWQERGRDQQLNVSTLLYQNTGVAQ